MKYFFTRHIKSNPALDKIAIYLINILMHILKAIRPGYNSGSNVVIISLHRLGDSVFTISSIKKIQDHHNSDIYLVCYEETIPIYKLVLKSVNFISISRNEFRFRLAVKSAREKINKLNPFIIYDLTGKATSVSMVYRSSAKEIVGCNEPYYRSIYTKFVPLRKEPHITDIYLDAISPVISDRNVNRVEYEINKGGEYILIHPFAGYDSKEWGLRKFIMLAESLNQNFECRIICPPQKIQDDVIKVIHDKNIKIIETKTTDDLIEVIKRCSIFIGNDSGPAHIANLLGKPTFTIYGPTNPDYHKPILGINNFIIKELKCSPQKGDKFCYTHGGVFCPAYECMDKLSFNEVKSKVDDFISRI
jgi:ADP-heptose:LPS heptosyltransferase